jgi:hypothetical protein
VGFLDKKNFVPGKFFPSQEEKAADFHAQTSSRIAMLKFKAGKKDK